MGLDYFPKPTFFIRAMKRGLERSGSKALSIFRMVSHRFVSPYCSGVAYLIGADVCGTPDVPKTDQLAGPCTTKHVASSAPHSRISPLPRYSSSALANLRDRNGYMNGQE